MCLSFFNEIASNLRLVGTDMPYDMTTITFHNYQSDQNGQFNNFYQLKISRNGDYKIFFFFFIKPSMLYHCIW